VHAESAAEPTRQHRVAGVTHFQHEPAVEQFDQPFRLAVDAPD
jgi:hypothetical protein